MRNAVSYSILATMMSTHIAAAFLFQAQASDNPQIISFCTGASFGCALFKDLGVKCFGNSFMWGEAVLQQGRQSDGLPIATSYGSSAATLGKNLPYVNIGNNLNITQVSCGGTHLCAGYDNGKMKCLGNNQYGQLGIGSSKLLIGKVLGIVGNSLPFVNLGSGLQALQIATGKIHTCAKVTGGLLKCFGENSSGQLGLENRLVYGKLPRNIGDNLPFVNVGTNATIISVHSGSTADHNCVILSFPLELSQRMKCWGLNNRYQLGYGDAIARGAKLGQMGDNLTLVDLGAESRVKQVSVGGQYTCSLLVNDALKCFGFNIHGALGLGTSSIIVPSMGDKLPAVPNGDQNIISVVAGESHTCIVYDDLVTLKCIGRNNYGQLGQGDTIDRGSTQMTTLKSTLPVRLGTGNLQILSVHIGTAQTCVVFVDSSVKCFGDNSFGQCAAGTQKYIGISKDDMGNNLRFAGLMKTSSIYYGTFSPTIKPTNKPTFRPTYSITRRPSPQKFGVEEITISPTKSLSQSSFACSIFTIFAILVPTICLL